jgi:SAM-dependent methyltransferase
MVAQRLAPAEEFAGRLFESGVAGIEVLSVYLGERLGYYTALHEGGAQTSAELAARTGTHERYTREWLEQQATAQILAVDDAGKPAAERRYSLPEGYEEILVNPLSMAYMAPLGRFLKVMGAVAEPLLDVYRTGAGLSWGAMGEDARLGQAAFNRPFFINSLVADYLKQLPELDAALSSPGARVAEIGPGGGWALIAIAQAYPDLRGDGFDLDAPSVEMANGNIARAGVGDRVAVHCKDAASADMDGEYDLVAAFECIHDMSNPVGVLRTMRRLAKPGGTVLVMDERVADEFGNFGDPVERLLYGASLFVCLPDGMSHQPSAATGTVMRAPTLRRYALEAGFSDVEVLPLAHDLFQFYRLLP